MTMAQQEIADLHNYIAHLEEKIERMERERSVANQFAKLTDEQMQSVLFLANEIVSKSEPLERNHT